MIPRGASREKLSNNGKIKDIPFFRYMNIKETKAVINEAFSSLGSELIFLKSKKNNSLAVAEKQELDGSEVIDLAGHGCLYLLAECPVTPTVGPCTTVVPSTSVVPPSVVHAIVVPRTTMGSASAVVQATVLPCATNATNTPVTVAPTVTTSTSVVDHSILDPPGPENTEDLISKANEVLAKLRVSCFFILFWLLLFLFLVFFKKLFGIIIDCRTHLYCQRDIQ